MKILPLLLAGAVLSPALGSAITLFGLTSGNGLVSFDSATPGSVSTIGTISQAGIVDIDYYPVNGGLYGATGNGTLYRIDPTSGVATLAATPNMSLTGVTDIDFNPAADRIRVFGAGDSNFRLTPDVFNNTGLTAGGVTVDGFFTNTAVNLVGSAYTNNFDGVMGPTTQLFSIDSVGNNLYAHVNAAGDPAGSFNQVNLIGSLGITAGLNVGFDIGQDRIAYLSSDNSLYTVDLATGTASSLGTVGGAGLVSIAAVAVPEASTVSALLLTGLAALGRRRRAGSGRADVM